MAGLRRASYMGGMRFERVSEESLGALVRAFYGRARADGELGPVFNAAVEDWEAHFETLTAFWSAVMLGDRRYSGRPMQAHMRQPIRPEMFERWLAIWEKTTAELFEPAAAAELQGKAHQIGRGLKLGLFFRPEQAEGAGA
jgi:hemoglobin